MALNSYSALKTSIANWLNRSDLTTEIEDFIVLAEKDFNSKLRIRQMVSTDSSFSINAETVALPTGFLQVRDFFIIDGGSKHSLQYITSTNGSNKRIKCNWSTHNIYDNW